MRNQIETKLSTLRSLFGLVACATLLAALLGGCASAPSLHIAADWAQQVCECTTDIDCETNCGGIY